MTESAAQAAPTKIMWYGHATFSVTTPNGTVVFLDPWLTNPSNPQGKEALASVSKADFIMVSHGHFDHTADVVALAKKSGAKVVAAYELAKQLVWHGGMEQSSIYMGGTNIGGELQAANGELMMTLVPAVHGSGYDYKTADGKSETAYGGPPVGLVLVIKGGPTIYSTGDTAYFSDMKLIGEMYHPDVILVNIGGHFGMEANMAAKAVEAVGAKYAVPMHYKTFPILTQDEGPFVRDVEKMGVKAVVMKPLQTISFEGKQLQ